MTSAPTAAPSSDFRRRARSRWRRIRNPTLRWLSAPVVSLLGALPWSSAQTVGRMLGGLAWRAGRRDRARALEHLAIAFPEMSVVERARLGRESARHHGMNFAECLHLLKRDLSDAASHIEIVGREHLEAVQDRSALVVTGHCGNWELLSPAFQSLGLPLAAVVRALNEDWAEDVATRLRQRFGTRVVRRGRSETVRGLLAILRRPTFLAMLIDQDIRAESVWVPFFGRLARTPVGPTDLALRRSLPVIPAFAERLPSGKHRVSFHRRLDLPPERVAATAVITRAVEEQIRRCPAQWVWSHRRWRRPPPAKARES